MRRRGAALAFALAGGAALAQEGTELAPDRAPKPEARPEAGTPQSVPSPDAEAGPPDEGLSLIPPEEAAPSDQEPVEAPSATSPEGATSPDDPDAPPADQPGENLSLVPPAQVELPAEAPIRELLAETEAALATCLSALDELGVTYERTEPILEPDASDCGIANPIEVSAIAPGVALEPAPTLRCEAALSAARWVADVVLPLGAKLEGRGALVAIDQGTGYLCRPRADGAPSDHSYGNALDIMGFRFASGDPIPVEPRAGDGTLEEAFQRAVRAGACLDFTTVLGPGSDADHADHLHLDVKARESGFRICQ